MPIPRIDRSYRHLRRYRQILTTLVKYGYGDIIDRLKGEYYLRFAKKLSPRLERKELRRLPSPQRIRLALEELGPTFVKLGQMISVRPDLVPPDFIHELAKLQDEVPPFKVELARQVIAAELGTPVEVAFDYFEDKPIAAASIAQVHRARISGGEEVVVKIQRPNIRSSIETDIGILFDLAELLERQLPESRLYNPTGIVEEFAQTIRKEMDFIREGQSIDRFQRNFASDETIYIPKVYWHLTTARVVTIEFIDGIKCSEMDAIRESGLDPKQIALNGANAILRQVFEFGFFHADPHPGNIFVLPGNVIAPLDFGMMGRLDEELRAQIASLLQAVVNKDMALALRVFSKMGMIEVSTDLRTLKLDLDDLLDRYYQVPLQQIQISTVMNEIMGLVRKHGIRAPTDLVLMAKALATVEGIGYELDPDFDFIAVAKPYVRAMMMRKLDPGKQLKEAVNLLTEFIELFKAMPGDVDTILTKLKTGQLCIKFEHQGLEKPVVELDKSSNRISFSLIIAALIVASSLLVHSSKGPLLMGLPLFGILGYLIAAVLGLWLVVAILRSGKL